MWEWADGLDLGQFRSLDRLATRTSLPFHAVASVSLVLPWQWEQVAQASEEERATWPAEVRPISLQVTVFSCRARYWPLVAKACDEVSVQGLEIPFLP